MSHPLLDSRRGRVEGIPLDNVPMAPGHTLYSEGLDQLESNAAEEELGLKMKSVTRRGAASRYVARPVELEHAAKNLAVRSFEEEGLSWKESQEPEDSSSAHSAGEEEWSDPGGSTRSVMERDVATITIPRSRRVRAAFQEDDDDDTPPVRRRHSPFHQHSRTKHAINRMHNIPWRTFTSVRGVVYDIRHWKQLPPARNGASGFEVIQFACTRDGRTPYIILFFSLGLFLLAFLGSPSHKYD
jgi:hypothetical protein